MRCRRDRLWSDAKDRGRSDVKELCNVEIRDRVLARLCALAERRVQIINSKTELYPYFDDALDPHPKVAQLTVRKLDFEHSQP
jgi:hypothetical protein